MELYKQQYNATNRILLSAIGLWPYDNFKIRLVRFVLILLIIMSFFSSQWIKLYTSEYNSDLLLKILSYNIPVTICLIKYISFYAVFENIKKFGQLIRNNWDALKDNREIEIIRKQENYGKLFTLYITIFGLISSVVFICTQYISIILDIVIPLNVSRPRQLLFLAEYFMDPEKYFYIISVCLAIELTVVITCLIATELFSVTNALYAFGLFKIARFSDLLKVSFGQAYLILFAMGVCSASINLFNLSRMITTEKEILEIIKSLFLIASHIIYLTVANYAGQEFINCDTHFYRVVCDTEWYGAPLKTQKLILFLIQKTTRCYKVDAGGMFNPSLEGLATSLSMSISYFMVLYSVSS